MQFKLVYLEVEQVIIMMLVVIILMYKWMKKLKLEEGDSLQIQIQKKRSKRQYINYHKLNKHQHHQSPHLSPIKPNSINNGLSPISVTKIGQGTSPISAQKSLIIKNMHLEPSASRQHLFKGINLSSQKLQSTNNKLRQQSFLQINCRKQEKGKDFSKQIQKSRFRIKQSFRMKTQQIRINLFEKKQRYQDREQKRQKKERNSHDKIQKLSKQISKSIVLNDLTPSYLAQKLHNNNESEIHLKQSSLFQNQSTFLKIHKLSPKMERNRLYFTENGKDSNGQPDVSSHKQKMKTNK